MIENIKPNAIMVCVNYADLLAVTLPYNRHHFNKVMVVTSYTDKETQDTIALFNSKMFTEYKVDHYCTNAFYEDGALFNKFKALEEGLDIMGRKDWLCVMDADVLWPRNAQLMVDTTTSENKQYRTYNPFEKGYLYTPLRRMAPLIHQQNGQGIYVPPEEQWQFFPIHRNIGEWAGYSQVFHASDVALGKPPWHDITWSHAGGGDSFFQMKWRPENKIRPNFEVLHLGDAGINWAGRDEGSRQVLRRLLEVRRDKMGRADRFDHEKIK